MDLEIQQEDGVSIFTFDGPVTKLECATLRSRFRETLESGSRNFVFDFVEVPFVDSASIGETVACLKRARQRDGDLKLVLERESRLYHLLKLTSLDEVFEFYYDRREAVAAFDS